MIPPVTTYIYFLRQSQMTYYSPIYDYHINDNVERVVAFQTMTSLESAMPIHHCQHIDR